MTNVDSTLKSRDITLPTKVWSVKAMVFPVITASWMDGSSFHCYFIRVEFHWTQEPQYHSFPEKRTTKWNTQVKLGMFWVWVKGRMGSIETGSPTHHWSMCPSPGLSASGKLQILRLTQVGAELLHQAPLNGCPEGWHNVLEAHLSAQSWDGLTCWHGRQETRKSSQTLLASPVFSGACHAFLELDVVRQPDHKDRD